MNEKQKIDKLQGNNTNTILPSVLVLQNPEKYSGYSKHPAKDKTIRQVKEAIIQSCRHLEGWVTLEICFTDGEKYYDSSPSVRGAKQQFAFLIKKGSKWLPK